MENQSRTTLIVTLTIALFAGLAGGYVWYWNQLADGLHDSLKIWLGQRRAEGFVAESGPVTLSGFPLSVTANIASLELGRSEKGDPGYWRWQAKNITATLKPRQPWLIHIQTTAHQSSEFVDTKNQLRTLKIVARVAKGIVEIGSDGRLAAVSTRFEALGLTGTALPGPVLAAGLKASINFLRDTRIDIQGDSLRLPREIDPLFGENMDVLRAKATITGPLPRNWSRTEITAWRDEGGTIDLTRGRIKWGDLDITANGTFALDARMRLQGSGTASMQGHNESIKVLTERSMITPLNAAALTIGLNLLGQQDKDTVKLPFSAQNGQLKVGAVSAAILKPLQFPGE